MYFCFKVYNIRWSILSWHKRWSYRLLVGLQVAQTFFSQINKSEIVDNVQVSMWAQKSNRLSRGMEKCLWALLPTSHSYHSLSKRKQSNDSMKEWMLNKEKLRCLRWWLLPWRELEPNRLSPTAVWWRWGYKSWLDLLRVLFSV